MTEVLVKKAALIEEDWNFSKLRVPDDELVPCLLWEFLRESKTARTLAKDWVEFGTPGGATSDQNLLWERMRALKFSLNHKIEMTEFIDWALGPSWMTKRLANISWQKLPLKTRQKLAEPATTINEPVFLSMGNLHTMHIDRTMQKLTTEADDTLVNGIGAPYPPARAMLESLTRGKGCEAFCIVVDWGRYDDEAIRESFTKLAVTIKRPPGIIPQVKKGAGLGNPNEWRGKLNGLGRTRIHCYYNGVETLKRMNQPAYEWVVARSKDKGTTSATKILDAAKGRFLEAFQEIFPFEQGNLPLCVANSRFAR